MAYYRIYAQLFYKSMNIFKYFSLGKTKTMLTVLRVQYCDLVEQSTVALPSYVAHDRNKIHRYFILEEKRSVKLKKKSYFNVRKLIKVLS